MGFMSTGKTFRWKSPTFGVSPDLSKGKPYDLHTNWRTELASYI